MMREIGSEFWNAPVADKSNNLLPTSTKWFLSGRTALRFVLQDILATNNVRTAALPSYCCHTMIEPFLDFGLDVSFYPITLDSENHLKQDLSQANGADIILVLDYFGFNRSNECPKGSIIIRDMTHSIFCGDRKLADYYFGSLRKWFFVSTGGYAWKNQSEFVISSPDKTDIEYATTRVDAAKAKAAYIDGQLKNKAFLDVYAKAENYLDSFKTVCSATENDIDIATRIDQAYLQNKRKNNARVLLDCDKISSRMMFSDVNHSDCPLFVPIACTNGERDSLRAELIKENIYCPVHWPISNLHKLNHETKVIYDSELSIVCDQRYDTDDMGRIVDVISNFYK